MNKPLHLRTQTSRPHESKLLEKSFFSAQIAHAQLVNKPLSYDEKMNNIYVTELSLFDKIKIFNRYRGEV
jgi:hypothetical protein